MSYLNHIEYDLSCEEGGLKTGGVNFEAGIRVKRVPQASPYGWSEREFQTLKEMPKNQREMILQHHSAKLSAEHQANFETLWSPVGDWWFPTGGKEDRALPRRGWKLGAVEGARRPFWSNGVKNPHFFTGFSGPYILHWCFTFINTGFFTTLHVF